MKRTLCGLLLLLATSVVAQQQGQPPMNSPPYGTPPTFPEGQVPRQPMPPDQEAPPRGLSNREAQQQILQGLKSEPGLRNSNIGVHVDKASVVLTGTIHSEDQHELARRIARSYAGDRQILDKLKLRQQT